MEAKGEEEGLEAEEEDGEDIAPAPEAGEDLAPVLEVGLVDQNQLNLHGWKVAKGCIKYLFLI